MTDDLRGLNDRDAAVCHGRAVVKGTRVAVSVVLDALASGLFETEIVAEYPSLTSDGVRGRRRGAELARNEPPATTNP